MNEATGLECHHDGPLGSVQDFGAWWPDVEPNGWCGKYKVAPQLDTPEYKNSLSEPKNTLPERCGACYYMRETK